MNRITVLTTVSAVSGVLCVTCADPTPVWAQLALGTVAVACGALAARGERLIRTWGRDVKRLGGGR